MTKHDPHPATARMLQAATQATAHTEQPIASYAELAQRMDVSSAVMANWKRRGPSKEGAIEAARLFGCDPTYIMHGRFNSPPRTGVVLAMEPRPSYGPAPQLGETLQTLGELLADMDSMTRNTVGSLLAELVKSPADRGTIAAMAEAMTQARKRA